MDEARTADCSQVSFETAITRVAELDRIVVGSTAARSKEASGDSFEHALQAELERASPSNSSIPSSTGFGAVSIAQPIAAPAGYSPYAGYAPAMSLGATAPIYSALPPQFGQVAGAPGLSMLRGDVDGLDPSLAASLERVAEQIGQPLEIVSGFRSRAEQEDLYNKFLNGTGNLAAPPGTSRHESGRAADVYVAGTALQNVPGAAQAAQSVGLTFPVGGEPWHVEPVLP